MYDFHTRPLPFRVDRETGILTGIGDISSGVQLTLEELTGGKYSVSGTTIRDKSNGRIVWNFSRATDIQIDYFPSSLPYRTKAGIQIINSIGDPTLRQAAGVNAQYVGSFSFEAQAGEDEAHEFTASYVSLTAIGSRVFYNPELTGNAAYREIVAGPDGIVQEAQALADGYRLATREEILTRAIQAYLMAHKIDDLYELIKEGFEDRDGNTFQTEYELATYLARINMDSVEYYSRGYFNIG